MNIHTLRQKSLYSKAILIGWIGLVVFAMHASIFFLASEHVMLTMPCAGMSSAVCPILGHDLLRIDHPLILSAQPEISYSFNTVRGDASLMTVVFFVLSLFACAWQHIRKRNYLYLLVNRYVQAFSNGILNSRIYA